MADPLPHIMARTVHEEGDPSIGFHAELPAPSAVDPEWTAAYVEMLKESLCLFASDVLGIELGPHLFAWESLVLNHPKVAINAARDHSKCHPGDTLILRADGVRVRIDEWCGGEVLAMDERGKLVRAYAPPSEPNGVHPVLRVTTRTGRSVDVTPNHPLRTFEGWKAAGELDVGERIAVPRRLPVRDLVESAVLWDEVVDIQVLGEQETWALCVPGLENYVANDIVNHNSTFFSYAYPIWRAWREPGCEVYIFSKTQDQAIEFLDIILNGRNNLKGLIATSSLEHLVPRDRTKTGVRVKKTDLRLTNGSRIRAVGYGKAIRGAHPKYIVLDDPLNDDDMWSDTQREKHIEYFKSAITHMVPPDGQICVVGTPYHISDLYGFLRKNPKYVFRRYPGILKDPKTGEQKALFPWRWPIEELLDKKIEVGPVSFAREILCEPITDDLAIFPSWLFPPLYDDKLVMRPTKSEIQARGWTTFIGIDIARSANVGADYFVIFVQAKDNEGTRFLVDIRRERGWTFKQQIDLIKIMSARYDPAIVMIEANQMQQVWPDEIRRTTDIPVKEFVTTAANKYPLDKGLPGLRIILENQKLVIPRGDEYSRRMADIWQEEAQQFGFVDGKLQGIGAHDDTVMAWWICEEATKSGGFSFGFGDEDADIEDEMYGGDGDWEKEMLGEGDDEEYGI